MGLSYMDGDISGAMSRRAAIRPAAFAEPWAFSTFLSPMLLVSLSSRV
jgi:hypothetical protein